MNRYFNEIQQQVLRFILNQRQIFTLSIRTFLKIVCQRHVSFIRVTKIHTNIIIFFVTNILSSFHWYQNCCQMKKTNINQFDLGIHFCFFLSTHTSVHSQQKITHRILHDTQIKNKTIYLM